MFSYSSSSEQACFGVLINFSVAYYLDGIINI